MSNTFCKQHSTNQLLAKTIIISLTTTITSLNPYWVLLIQSINSILSLNHMLNFSKLKPNSTPGSLHHYNKKHLIAMHKKLLSSTPLKTSISHNYLLPTTLKTFNSTTLPNASIYALSLSPIYLAHSICGHHPLNFNALNISATHTLYFLISTPPFNSSLLTPKAINTHLNFKSNLDFASSLNKLKTKKILTSFSSNIGLP